MNVSDIMSSHVICVGQDESVGTAARLLKRYNLGALPVCDSSGRLRGVVTDRDIVLRCVAAEDDPAQTPVRDIMSRAPATLAPGQDILAAAQLMAQHQVRRLPVVERGKLVGIVSLGDVARSHRYDMEAALALSEISENVVKKD